VDEVKAAFRARAKQTHPDRGGTAAAFRTVREAYELLLNSLSRR
jgi:curved DNA-binding protein CbpA